MITQGGIIHLAHFRVCSKQRLRLCDGVLKEKVATATQDIFMEGGECREVVLLGLWKKQLEPRITERKRLGLMILWSTLLPWMAKDSNKNWEGSSLYELWARQHRKNWTGQSWQSCVDSCCFSQASSLHKFDPSQAAKQLWWQDTWLCELCLWTKWEYRGSLEACDVTHYMVKGWRGYCSQWNKNWSRVSVDHLNAMCLRKVLHWFSRLASRSLLQFSSYCKVIPGEEFSTTIASAGGRLFQLIRTIGWREDLNRLMVCWNACSVAGLLYIAVIEAKDSKDSGEDTVVTDLPIAAEKAEERFFSPLSKSLLMMLERETNQSASIWIHALQIKSDLLYIWFTHPDLLCYVCRIWERELHVSASCDCRGANVWLSRRFDIWSWRHIKVCIYILYIMSIFYIICVLHHQIRSCEEKSWRGLRIPRKASGSSLQGLGSIFLGGKDDMASNHMLCNSCGSVSLWFWWIFRSIFEDVRNPFSVLSVLSVIHQWSALFFATLQPGGLPTAMQSSDSPASATRRRTGKGGIWTGTLRWQFVSVSQISVCLSLFFWKTSASQGLIGASPMHCSQRTRCAKWVRNGWSKMALPIRISNLECKSNPGQSWPSCYLVKRDGETEKRRKGETQGLEACWAWPRPWTTKPCPLCGSLPNV